MSTVNQLADELLEVMLDFFPIGASLLGIPGRDDRMRDYTEAGDTAIKERALAIAGRAGELDPAGLGDDDRLTLGVVVQQAQSIVDTVEVRATEYAITDTWTAPAAALLVQLPMVALSDTDRAHGYLARLKQLPESLAQIAQRHRDGIAAGRRPVRHLVEGAVAHLDRYLANPDGDPLRKPAAEDDGFAAERDRLVAEVVRPAIAAYREVLAGEIAPASRGLDEAGMCFLPGGDDLYARQVRLHTTTGRTPDELHAIGLDLIAGLRSEFAEIGAEAFGTDDTDAVMRRLRTDPALRWRDGEEILDAARQTIERAEKAAPDWFGTLPAQRCTVAAVPADEAPGAPAAYYLAPAVDGSRPGIYFANTSQPGGRDRTLSEATAFHEGVPGHHLQISLALELTGLPLLRRIGMFTAYGEGWGLYAERLADEMGLYSGPLARLGMLATDSMRAARLVVDTGIHAKGWSREQVVDYLRANTVMPEVEIQSETDRYIADPGQALAYMVGRLEIRRLREDARAALGDRFDIRAFHDTVLTCGPLPLDILAERVTAWSRGLIRTGPR
ncbi:DUF885 domain-containing protein [Dactylosporangium sp. AC04546]|uniref:DUF885 domain-containing protein n=1 Tax=Dactylosporangium sp. AC04546 TaxID=2862460 RepID=UPI001EE0DCD3|nr:DUF885 domain-containing protein [Dactylosporangium sp. AC04546]WVK80712.1 DUF885 domain-containing protein [Dactylosporangium sp. AC04546]